MSKPQELLSAPLQAQFSYGDSAVLTPEEINGTIPAATPKAGIPVDPNFQLNNNADLTADELRPLPITQTPGAPIKPEQKRLDGTVTLWSWAEPYVKTVQGAYGESNVFAVDKALQMNRVVQGELNYDDIKNQYSEAAQKQYEALNMTPYKTQIPSQLMDYAVKPIVGSLPFIQSLFTSSETLVTTGVFTGVGAGVANAPGAAAGLGLGLMYGMGVTATKLATGDMYARLREAGLSHEQSVTAAQGAGLVNGIITALQGGILGNLTKEAITVGAKEIIKRVIAGQVANLTVPQLNEATNTVAQAVAAKQANNPDATPKDLAKHFTDIFLKGLAPSIALGIFSEGLGAAARTIEGKLTFNKALDHTVQALQQPIGQKTQSGGISQLNAVKTITRASKAAAKRAIRLAKQTAAEDEIHRIFNAANSKFTIEAGETFTKEKDRVQRVLKNLVDSSDVLDDKTKTNLLKRVLTIDSTKDLLREGKDFVDELRGAEYQNKIKTGQARIQKLIKAGQPKASKAKLPPNAQATLQAYAEFFTPEKMVGSKEHPATSFRKNIAMVLKAEKYITETYNTELAQGIQSLDDIETGKLSEVFTTPITSLEKARVAQQAIRYWSGEFTPDELNTIADQLESTIKDGRSIFLDAKEQEGKRLLQLRGEVKDGVQGSKPIIPSEENTPAKQLNKIQLILNSLTKNKTAIWEDLLRGIHPKDREKIVSKLDLTDTENKNWQLNKDSAEKLKTLLEDAAGSFDEAQKLISQGVKEEQFGIKYTDAQGNTKTLPRMSFNQLIYLRNALADNTALPVLIEGDKYTLKGMVDVGQTSTQEAIDTFLENHNPAYKDLGDAVKEFYQWYAPKAANHYLKEYGIVLTTYDDYSGRLFHYGIPDEVGAPDLLQGVQQYAKRIAAPASTIARTGSNLPVKLQDPFSQVVKHYTQHNFWIANSEKARELSFIFSDNSKDGLREIIKHKMGPEYMSLIDASVAYQFHLRMLSDTGMSGAAQWLKGNLATGYLGFDFTQPVKQWSSVLGALQEVDSGEFVKALGKATNKENLQAYLKDSQLYASRQDKLLPQILEATKSEGYTNFFVKDKLSKFKEINLIPMSDWGDGVASALTGYIGYDAARSRGLSHTEAVLFGDRLVDKTQSSSRLSQRVPAEFDREWGNLMLTFAKQNIQSINAVNSSLIDAFIYRDKFTTAKAARTLAGWWAANAFYQGMNSIPGFLGNDQQKKESILRFAIGSAVGPYSGIPMGIGDIIGGIASAIGGDKQISDPRTIIGSATKTVMTVGIDAAKIANKKFHGEDISTKDWWNLVKHAAGAGSTLTGVPLYKYYKTGEFGVKVYNKVKGRN